MQIALGAKRFGALLRRLDVLAFLLRVKILPGLRTQHVSPTVGSKSGFKRLPRMPPGTRLTPPKPDTRFRPLWPTRDADPGSRRLQAEVASGAASGNPGGPRPWAPGPAGWEVPSRRALPVK